MIDGFRGKWVKMADGKDGRPTPGMKPVGEAKDHWHGFQTSRGKIVSIEAALSDFWKRGMAE
jgi:hypothetical protein